MNKAGLDESTSLTSRAFELFSEGKTPLEVAIKLNLEANEMIRLHQEYFMLLGCTEFTKVYLHIKDDPWPYVNLVKLAIEKQMSTGYIMKLLNIANNELPSVESRYESLIKEIRWLECQKSRSAIDYQLLCNGVSNRHKTIDKLRTTAEQLGYEVGKLNQQKERMENFAMHFL